MGATSSYIKQNVEQDEYVTSLPQRSGCQRLRAPGAKR